MLWAVLLPFAIACVLPFADRYLNKNTAWLVASVPLALFAYFANHIPTILDGETVNESIEWVPSLGVDLAFRLDGLSLLFALLVTGIGALVFVYASGYLHHRLGIFMLYLMMFMASMLGVVLADNLVGVFVFWELTSITSYLLISFYNEKEASREAGKTALVVTGAGGLVMLAGLVLMALATDTWSLHGAIEAFDQNHEFYLPILILITVGAFAKSAQFPFHFWLPGAMEAPAPVSSYLHSATMVKAGIYLLARMYPALAGTDEWHLLIAGGGGITMLLGGYLAWQQTDVKRVLAYTTISALGIIVFLLGIGGGLAIKAAMLFVLVHALYKCGLFMVGGSLDHETGTRNLNALGGLLRVMPFTAGAAALGALSMAGIPPLLGFIGKELVYEATLEAEDLPILLLTGAAFFGNLFNVTAAAMVAITPFYGEPKHTPKHAHEAPWNMWLPPIILGLTSLTIGLFSVQIYEPLLKHVVEAVYHKEYEVHLGLFHGLTPMLALSVVTILGGLVLFAMIPRWRPLAQKTDVGEIIGPARWYHEGFMEGFLRPAKWISKLALDAKLRYYVRVILLVFVVMVAIGLARGFDMPDIELPEKIFLHEIALMLIIVVAAFRIPAEQKRLMAIGLLGAIGFSIAILYNLLSAPDLAMTQFAIETLTVILFILVIYSLPEFDKHSEQRTIRIDMAVGAAVAVTVTMLVWVITSESLSSELSQFFVENSYTVAKGHNVVNVILVDFRGFDTMGEITVLAAAAIGVYALLQLDMSQKDRPESADQSEPDTQEEA